MQIGHMLAAVALGAAIATAPAFAQEVYVLDPNHTIPMYEVTHMGYSQQRGSFTNATGKVTLDRAARKGAIEVTIMTASVTTGAARLVPHLKAEDFFDVEKFPTMTYKSVDLVFDGDNVVGANGELTLLGVTRPVALTVTGFKCGPHPFNKKPMCGAEATATIKRSEFGMKYGIPAAAGDDVRITIPIEAVRG
jgi:polyisoprenoid-binding protein YceI